MNEENTNPSMPDLSGIMDIISKNPEIVEKAASILEGMKSEGGMPPLGGLDPSALGAIIPAFKPSGGDKGAGEMSMSGPRVHHKHNRSCELLRALKPYLSKERCEAIDYMLSFSKIGDILGVIAPKDTGGEDV